MRRRQKYAESLSELVIPAGVSAISPPFEQYATISPVGTFVVVKGQCPKCLKTIGRGVAGHLRACNGNLS